MKESTTPAWGAIGEILNASAQKMVGMDLPSAQVSNNAGFESLLDACHVSVIMNIHPLLSIIHTILRVMTNRQTSSKINVFVMMPTREY